MARENDSFAIEYENEEINHVINRSVLQVLLYAICIFGIAFNLMILCKRTRAPLVCLKKFITFGMFRNKQASTTRISLRLLCYMAVADSISLAALLIVLSIQYLGIRDPKIMTLICKIDLFLIHSSSAFSIW